MVKVGLMGIGSIGRVHLNAYLKLEKEGFPIKLCAICDFDTDKFQNKFIKGNIEIELPKYDFSKYNLYTDIDEMLEKEELDYVDIALPTYLHKEATLKAFKKGFNVLCEKPMALKVSDCEEMLSAARASGKKLMIGQCLRFWPAYEYAKECIADGRYGKVNSAYFFRGSGAPKWSYDNWMLKGEKSGGATIDLHVHDVDMINWLFGKPKAVSSIARNVIPGSGYDIISTNYLYDDKVVNAQADWTLFGDYGFRMEYRINLEKGNLVFANNILTVNPNEGKAFVPAISTDLGHYREIKYFAQAIMNNKLIEISPPESTIDSMRIVEAELVSANKCGELVKVW